MAPRSALVLHTTASTMDNFKPCTLTIKSRWVGADGVKKAIIDSIASIPTSPDDTSLMNLDPSVVSKKKKGGDLQIKTGVVWEDEDVYITVRKTCRKGRKGSGSVMKGNFRNSVTFQCGKFGAKFFSNGSVQAYAFTSEETFKSFSNTILASYGDAHIDTNEGATEVVLAILDSAMQGVTKPLHLRAFAQECADRAVVGEHVEFNPDEYAGIKFKVPHPSKQDKTVSVTLRAKGTVKMFLGNPGVNVDGAMASVESRIKRLVGVV